MKNFGGGGPEDVWSSLSRGSRPRPDFPLMLHADLPFLADPAQDSVCPKANRDTTLLNLEQLRQNPRSTRVSEGLEIQLTLSASKAEGLGFVKLSLRSAVVAKYLLKSDAITRTCPDKLASCYDPGRADSWKYPEGKQGEASDHDHASQELFAKTKIAKSSRLPVGFQVDCMRGPAMRACGGRRGKPVPAFPALDEGHYRSWRMAAAASSFMGNTLPVRTSTSNGVALSGSPRTLFDR